MRAFLFKGVLVLFVGIFFNRFSPFSLVSLLEHGISCLVYPVLVAHYHLAHGSKNIFIVKDTQGQQGIIDALLNERENLLQELTLLKSSCHFVQETQEMIEFKKRYEQPVSALTHIIFRHFSEGGHFFLIDRGSVKGVTLDMIAVYKNCLVGRVVEVHPYYSKVALITDKSCTLAAYCSATGTAGIHQGMNDDAVTTLEHVSHLHPVKNQDLILSSGEGLVFPRGFALGTVQYNAIHEGVYHVIRLKPLLDFHALNYCYLLHKGEIVDHC